MLEGLKLQTMGRIQTLKDSLADTIWQPQFDDGTRSRAPQYNEHRKAFLSLTIMFCDATSILVAREPVWKRNSGTKVNMNDKFTSKGQSCLRVSGGDLTIVLIGKQSHACTSLSAELFKDVYCYRHFRTN